jgi:hypothetical protein
MLDRAAIFTPNIAQAGDALALLQSLPDASAALGFFDPQFRELLTRQAEAMLLAITPVPGVILPKAAPITTTEFAEITA